MPKARNNRLRIFPNRQAAAEAAEERRRKGHFPKVVPDTIADGLNVVRRDNYRGRSVFSTYLCEDGRFRFLDICVW